MANVYWVGGTGTWDTTATANWSASTGGAAGAAAPTSSDTAIFDAASGGGVVTLGEAVAVSALTMTGFAGELAAAGFAISLAGASGTLYTGDTTYTTSGTPLLRMTAAGSSARTITCGAATEANAVSLSIEAGSGAVTQTGSVMHLTTTSGFGGSLASQSRTIYGDLTIAAGTTVTVGTAYTVFASTSGTPRTITMNGVAFGQRMGFNGAGGHWKFADTFVQTGGEMYLANGTLDGNGQNVTVGGQFYLAAGTKTLTLGSGTWTAAGAGANAWNLNTNSAGLTVTASTGTISMTSASAKTFAGGGKTWPTLNQGGAGALTITGSNTFADITATSLPSTISFTDGTTQTVVDWNARGIAGSLLTLGPTGAGTWSIGKAGGGPVNLDYLSVSKSIALYRDWFAGRNSTDGGGNTGWRFTPYSSLIPLILPRRR